MLVPATTHSFRFQDVRSYSRRLCGVEKAMACGGGVEGFSRRLGELARSWQFDGRISWRECC